MNTEELRAIIEVIKTLTSDGLTGFIWYLVIDKVVNTLILGGIAFAIIRVIAATCVQVSKPDHPPLCPTPPQRKPLTEDEISEIAMDCSFVSESDTYFARAIEKAHGIE
jgi:hypothetical protein